MRCAINGLATYSRTVVMTACVTVISAVSSRGLHSSSSSSTQLVDGKTLWSSAWRVTFIDQNGYHRQVLQSLCLESPAQFSSLRENTVEQVHAYNCVLLAEAFLRLSASGLWVFSGILLRAVIREAAQLLVSLMCPPQTTSTVWSFETAIPSAATSITAVFIGVPIFLKALINLYTSLWMSPRARALLHFLDAMAVTTAPEETLSSSR